MSTPRQRFPLKTCFQKKAGRGRFLSVLARSRIIRHLQYRPTPERRQRIPAHIRQHCHTACRGAASSDCPLLQDFGKQDFPGISSCARRNHLDGRLRGKRHALSDGAVFREGKTQVDDRRKRIALFRCLVVSAQMLYRLLTAAKVQAPSVRGDFVLLRAARFISWGCSQWLRWET